jgi:hypothetical protein
VSPRVTAEAPLAPSGEGSVVLDIGADRGAAIIYTPESLSGSEIEIRASGSPWDGTHTGVRRRDLREAICFAGVFGSVPAGQYQLRVRGSETTPIVDLVVAGGAIAEVTWPTGAVKTSQTDPRSTPGTSRAGRRC